MAVVGALTEADAAADVAYPGETPPDPVFPAQTLEPLSPVLDGVAVPATWSRLRPPLERALNLLWEKGGLSDRGRPPVWVGLQVGRLSINAHGWERLASTLQGVDPDPALVAPVPRGLARLGARLERVRVAWWRRRLEARVLQAQARALAALERVEAIDVESLDLPPLARGPLDEWAWTEILLPWLSARLMAFDPDGGLVERALRVERRFVSEVGRRLVNASILHKRADVAYLTVTERILASNDRSDAWMRTVERRARRVQAFAEIEVPQRFWGRPRLGVHPDAR